MTNMDDWIRQKSGVSNDAAFAIDSENLFASLGVDVFKKLSRSFYDRVYADEVVWFRNIFKNKDKEEAIQNQYEFFIQRMGGPALYSERKGHPALAARHMNFNMTEKAAERWLFHMRAALESVPEIDEPLRKKMYDYFAHTAYFLSFRISQKN